MQQNDEANRNDDQRTVIVTPAKLRAFERATREEADAKVAALRTSDALDAATDAHKAALKAYSDAQDATEAAARALYETRGA